MRRRRRRRKSRWEGAASAPQERRRERERDWSRRHEASSLLGDERHFYHTLNNRISLGAAMYFGM